MVNCCQPNPVQLVNGCWEWCEIPTAMTNGSSHSAISATFENCLQASGRNLTVSRGLLVHVSAATTTNSPVSVVGIMVAALVALVALTPL
ncbi:uncharacterized protein CTRU02_202569 [Colletotrichum truncatum]|uniref:Uncharacterized protein n=1 Tax=Colletotrichum truncatum TaxID=5467 RepID=A0ACC3ZKL6_COLTU|nr:uncharacterized protein CTRU02_01737 [Colletotrichum truncatum]KAF6800058.1 hypothetical protein CTRU02_01737 [Colletotrichum truncatum]